MAASETTVKVDVVWQSKGSTMRSPTPNNFVSLEPLSGSRNFTYAQRQPDSWKMKLIVFGYYLVTRGHRINCDVSIVYFSLKFRALFQMLTLLNLWKSAWNCNEKQKNWTRWRKSMAPPTSHAKKNTWNMYFLSSLVFPVSLFLCPPSLSVVVRVMLCCAWGNWRRESATRWFD